MNKPSSEIKKLLLVDTGGPKRDLRAEVLRKLGVEVDCADDIHEANTRWRAGVYNLVLIAVKNEALQADEFCVKVRAAKPRQRVAFLVGKLKYLAYAPAALDDLDSESEPGQWSSSVKAHFSDSRSGPHQHWGLKEAAWRIAALKSLKDPRPQDQPTEGKPLSRYWTESVKYSQALAAEISPSDGLHSQAMEKEAL